MNLAQTTAAELTAFALVEGWLPDNAKIVDLKSAGEGNMNCVRRAILDTGASLIVKQSLPYVAKYPDIPAPIERIAREHAFYQATQGTLCGQRLP